MERVKLSPSIVSSFDVARVHRQHSKPVSCLDFSQDGKTLVSSSADDSIVVYDAVKGTASTAIPVRKYGAGVLRFIQDNNPPTIISASTTGDHQIRALDLQRETYVRYFNGHDSQVVSISSSPVGPQFISSSQDSYVRVWDCRKRIAVGKVRGLGTPLVAYDPKGLIFGIAYNAPNLNTLVKLYDTRKFYEGPFLEFALDKKFDSVPTCFKFSSDGEYFLVVNADVSASVTMYDAYKGHVIRTLTGHRNASGMPLEASFSADSEFVASGSGDGSVYVWQVKSGSRLVEKMQVHAMPSACVLWNPVYGMISSACQNVVMWLPERSEAMETETGTIGQSVVGWMVNSSVQPSSSYGDGV